MNFDDILSQAGLKEADLQVLQSHVLKGCPKCALELLKMKFALDKVIKHAKDSQKG
jgi:hypothetical protein